MPTFSKRPPMVPGPSSHAVMPLPEEAMALAVAARIDFFKSDKKVPPTVNRLLATVMVAGGSGMVVVYRRKVIWLMFCVSPGTKLLVK